MQVRCQGAEAKYLVRALQGKLRIGTAFQTVLVALSRTFADLQPAFAENFATTTTTANEEEIEEEGDVQMRTSKKAHVSAFAVEDEEVQKSAVMDVDAATSNEVAAASSSSPEESVEEMLRNVHDNETPEARKLRLHFTGIKRLSQQVRHHTLHNTHF